MVQYHEIALRCFIDLFLEANIIRKKIGITVNNTFRLDLS